MNNMNDEIEQKIKAAYLQGKIEGLKEGRIIMDKMVEDIRLNNTKLFALISPK